MSEDDKMMSLRIPESLIHQIDDFRFKYRFMSRTEAIRWLIQYALQQKPRPPLGGD
jgi:Arc/MetJ-type ribon-helix-helix transcriptional regulator